MADLVKLKGTLENLGYTVSCFDKKEEAAEYLNKEIDGVSVGFGGSVTVKQMGLFESLGAHNRVLWHWQLSEAMSAAEERIQAASTDVYICSVNGLAETGEIINIDGTGNRLASTLFGHKKVYLVIGENKIAEDYDKALFRARNIAAPLNAKRLGRKTPCAVNADRCYNCSSPERICKALTVFWRKPDSCAMEIVLIGEALGM